jgi:hypothetical protein
MMIKNKMIVEIIFTTSVILLIFFSSLNFAFAQSGEDPLAGTSVEEVMKNNASTTASPTTGTASTTTSSSYSNQEKIPGYEQTSDFPTYMKQIVNFFFATIGILAMFMLMIGAYQYLMAAGNIAKEDSAKTTISSALSGLILGLIAYLLLYTINPDLVAFKLDALSTSTSGSSSNSSSGSSNSSTTPSQNAGKCVEGTGNCAESNLSCFGSDAKNASIVCNAESGGQIKVGGDSCGSSSTKVSYGLFQVNVTCHDLGMGCTKAFNGCLGSGVTNSTCKVSDVGLYQKCIAAMQNETTNIQTACSIYNSTKGNKWKPWSGASKCKIST